MAAVYQVNEAWDSSPQLMIVWVGIINIMAAI